MTILSIRPLSIFVVSSFDFYLFIISGNYYKSVELDHTHSDLQDKFLDFILEV